MFAALDPEQFKTCFSQWVKSLQEQLNDVIAIDGKTLRGSAQRSKGRSAIHRVSAFASGAKLILAQQVVDEKSTKQPPAEAGGFAITD